MPRLSANLGLLWPDRPLPGRVDAAAAAGFRAIELHFPYDVPAIELRERCERLGLQILGLNTAPGDRARGEFGLGAVPGREAEFRAAIDQAIAYCRDSGARAIHCMAGFVTPAQRADAAAVFEDNLREALRRIAHTDLVLLLEPLNARDQPGYFLSRVEQAVALIERIAHPALRLQFDAYHVALAGDDVFGLLRRHLGLIAHVQLAGVPTRQEPDAGTLDLRALFDQLDALGYGGWVGCEYHPRGATEDGLAWAQPWLETRTP